MRRSQLWIEVLRPDWRTVEPTFTMPELGEIIGWSGKRTARLLISVGAVERRGRFYVTRLSLLRDRCPIIFEVLTAQVVKVAS